MAEELPAPLTINQALTMQVARLEERSIAAEKALQLQAAEMSRRLDELNHAARIREERDKGFVSHDKYEGLYREFLMYREQVNKTLHELEGRTSGMHAARNDLFRMTGVALVILAIGVSVVFGILKL